MSPIYNFHKVSALLACAGQPTESQVAAIASDGYKVIINLGLADGKYALNNEAASVIGLGMEYHHIPVSFNNPQISELAAFIMLMNKHQDEKIF
ncbi:MAG TPA: sulfur transferase domain-containing protein, partial [Mucilaginibacter sp.]